MYRGDKLPPGILIARRLHLIRVRLAASTRVENLGGYSRGTLCLLIPMRHMTATRCHVLHIG